MTKGTWRDRKALRKMSLSPLLKKRLRAFRRIRRARVALWAFGAIFAFCMCAEFVCPCDPRAVVDPASLEKYRRPVVEKTYDVKTARFSVDSQGVVFDYEGPESLIIELANNRIIELADNKISELTNWRISELANGRIGESGEDSVVHSFDYSTIRLFDYFSKDYDIRRTPRDGYVRVFLEPKEPPAETEVVLPAPEVSFPFRPVPEHPFGIDAGGRDVYARVVHGMRIALLFGLALALSGMLFGLVVGAVEGYFGGWADIALQRFTEVWAAVPFLYVTIFVGSTVGRSFGVLLVCYAAFNWIAVSGYMRAEFLRLRRRPFVDAAKSGGISAVRIIFVHVLPNALTPLVTLFPFLLMGAIGSLAALDFLGFGLPPMTPSCGELLQEAQQFRFAWWLVVFPASALFVVMLLAVLVGEGLRDAFDPRRLSRLK